MKRAIALCLLVVALAALAGCNGIANADDQTPTSVDEPTERPTEEPEPVGTDETPEPTPAGTDDTPVATGIINNDDNERD